MYRNKWLECGKEWLKKPAGAMPAGPGCAAGRVVLPRPAIRLLRTGRRAPLAEPALLKSSAEWQLPADTPATRDPFRDSYEKNCCDDGNDESKEVQFEDIACSQQRGNHAADNGANKAQQQRGENAQILLAWLDETGKGSDDQACNDETNHDLSVLHASLEMRGQGKGCAPFAERTLFAFPIPLSRSPSAPPIISMLSNVRASLIAYS